MSIKISVSRRSIRGVKPGFAVPRLGESCVRAADCRRCPSVCRSGLLLANTALLRRRFSLPAYALLPRGGEGRTLRWEDLGALLQPSDLLPRSSAAQASRSWRLQYEARYDSPNFGGNHGLLHP